MRDARLGIVDEVFQSTDTAPASMIQGVELGFGVQSLGSRV